MKSWLIIAVLLLMFSCQGKQRAKTEPASSEMIKETVSLPVFPKINIPGIITEPQARAEYVALHYWDLFNFSDTVFITSGASLSEQAMVEYLGILMDSGLVSYSVAAEGIGVMLSKAEADTAAYRFWIELYRKYLYDGNSPLMNDEYYLPVLQAMTTSSVLTETQRQTAAVNLKVVGRNRPGTPATDFKYVTRSGRQSTLYALTAEYILIFFNNPGCHACGEIKDNIVASTLLSEMIASGRMKVLAVYPDEDMTEWYSHEGVFPASWINAYNPSAVIRHQELYDLKAIPMLYFLDRGKNVIFKDCQVTQIENYLSRR